MGLSSSQARLLNLTARMHQIEYKAAKLEAMKLQMANESTRVYEDYLTAIDATKIQYKVLNTDGSLNYVDATYRSMKAQGYELKFADSDKVVIDAATEANLLAAGNNRDYFIALQSGRVTTTDQTAPDGVVEIYTAEQLMNMTTGKNYRLMANIDLTGKNWTSKSLGTGKTFDGNGYTISGLTKALFSSVSGTVKNLNVEGNVSGTSRAILANTAYSGAVIENVSVSGSVTSSSSSGIGALVGTVSGSSTNSVTISNCSSSANVTSTSSSGNQIGGLIGYAYYAEISNCSATGSVSGYQHIGGFIGRLNNTTITNSTANVSVHQSAQNDTSFGGISGGFVGETLGNSEIINCASYGDIVGDGHILGGFVGNAATGSTISNCNAYGDVASNASGIITNNHSWAAGFASAVNGGNIENCNAYGSVSDSGNPALPNSLASFANVNMSGTANIGSVTNCYAADATLDFTNDAAYHTNMATVTQSTTENNNVITVASPTIATTTKVTDTTNAGALYDEIQENGYVLDTDVSNPVTGHEDDSTWFTNMVNAGELFIFKYDDDNELYQVSVSVDTGLQEVSDDTLIRKAEAQYEADMKRIDLKDRKYDTDLAALDTERNAISQEMETLKTVAKENVERTFKLFG